MTAINPRTLILLEAPIFSTIFRLAIPNAMVMIVQASMGLIETYFIGKLGNDSLAAMALVFPIVMLIQMSSAGAIGGAIASSIAQALGAQCHDDAEALVLHAILIALAFGLTFTIALLLGGRWIFSLMGGTDASLDAALIYSHWVFAGSVLIWIFNALAAVIRGTGNMVVPVYVTVGGALVLVPLSPLLIFGWRAIPGMGIAGGATALLLYYFVGSLVFWSHLRSSQSLLSGRLAGIRFQWSLFRRILGVGLIGAIATIANNLSVVIVTALTGYFGPSAIAGYGTAVRLEYLIVPLAFGFGAPLLTMVGTCIGAGNRERALKAAWVGAILVFAITEIIGLGAAFFPNSWLTLFGSDPEMLKAGVQYLQTVGPFYGFFGLGLVLHFASQGAGRLFWPVVGSLARLVIAGLGGWLGLTWGGDLISVFIVQGIAFLIYAIVITTTIAGGAWFGRVGWPCSTTALRQCQST